MMEPVVPFSGGCACGAIRYEATASPLAMFQCHCRDCQRATGGPFAAVVLLPAEAFRLTRGVPRYHASANLAGSTHVRGFCPECGSPVTGGQGDPPTPFVGVHASSLDDPSWFHPQMDIFVSRAQPWDRMDPELPRYDTYPPAGEDQGSPAGGPGDPARRPTLR